MAIFGLLNNRHTTWVDKINELLPDYSIRVTDDPKELIGSTVHCVFLMNFESAHTVTDYLSKHVSKLDLVAVDEAQKIYNRTTRQSKAIVKLRGARRKLILTGTPIEKRPTDMFMQMKFVAPSVFGENWKLFEKRYLDFAKVDFSRVRYGSWAWSQKIIQQAMLKRKAVFKTHMMGEFIAKLKPHCLRIDKEDVDIKRALVHKVVVPMSQDQLKAYRAIEDDKIFKGKGGFKSLADFPMTEVIRKRQITAGFLYDEDQSIYRFNDTPKEKKLIELFHRLPKPVVIFTIFKPDTDRIHCLLWSEGYDVEKLSGKTKKSRRPHLIRLFQRGQLDGLICQIKTGGAGTDMWKANYGIVHSMGHSFIDWDQALSRLDSHLKKKNPKIFLLCCENTVDEELYDLVIQKGLTGKAVLSQLKRSTEMTKENKEASEFKYTLSDVEKATGLKVASIRAALRTSSFNRDGASWGWNTKAELDEVLKFFKDRTTRRPDMTKGDKPAKESAKTKSPKAKGDKKKAA